MSAANPVYRKLPGKGRTWMGYERLWLADDHLLVAKTRGFAEHYERYYLRDVHALILRRTPNHGWRLAVMAALLALPLLAAWQHTAGRGAWLILATVFALFLAVEWLLGPSSACHLRTPLQTVELVPLRRLRNARRVLGELQIKIGELQGAMSADEFAAGLPEIAAQPEAPDVSTLKIVKPPPLPSHYRGRWHWVLFFALLLEALVTAVQLTVDSSALELGAMLLYLAVSSVALTALIKQRRSGIGRGVKRLSWAALAVLGVMFLSLWVLGLAQTFVVLAEDPVGFASPFDAAGIRFHYYGTIAGTGILGAWGLALLSRRRGRPQSA